ncbi:MAG: hypothetical protein J7J85_02310 [Deltaproteobacteria bacterium]|nr:hypothetical protein [Deltaproteobacteria bacterium]
MLDKIPFLHRDRAYNIIVEEDLSFDETHYILDCLLENGAFETLDDVSSDLYTLSYNGKTYTVGVDGLDVVIMINH